MEELYDGVRMLSGAEEFAMPNTLQLLGEKGVTFTRYYTPYSLCAPSRVSLLTGRYAHNDNVRGNVPPNGGWTGFQSRLAYSHNLATWLQGAGYRTIHIGKILNGYGDAPYSPGTEVPPGWSSWHTILNSDTNHYAYGYLLNNNGVVEGPVRRLGQLGNARIRRDRRRRLPLRAAERPALLLRDRQVQPAGDRRTGGDLAGTAVLHAGRLHLAAR